MQDSAVYAHEPRHHPSVTAAGASTRRRSSRSDEQRNRSTFVSNTVAAKQVGGGSLQRRMIATQTWRAHDVQKTLADLYFEDELSQLVEGGAAVDIAPLWLLQNELRQPTGQGRMQISQGQSRGAATGVAAPAPPIVLKGVRNTLPPPPSSLCCGLDSSSSSLRSDAGTRASSAVTATTHDFFLSSADSEEFENILSSGNTGFEALMFTDAAHLAFRAVKETPKETRLIASSSFNSLGSLVETKRGLPSEPAGHRSFDQAGSDFALCFEREAMCARNSREENAPRRARSDSC